MQCRHGTLGPCALCNYPMVVDERIAKLEDRINELECDNKWMKEVIDRIQNARKYE